MFHKLLLEHMAQAPLMASTVMHSWALEGVREDAGRNRGEVVDAIHEMGYGDDNDAAPWCARAVQAAWRAAGWATSQRLDPVVSRSGSVFYMLHTTLRRAPELVLLCNEKMNESQWAKFATSLRPGDALIRYTVRKGYEGVPLDERTREMTHLGHTEMVIEGHEDGTVTTVGGNTSSGDERDGEGVFVHRRLYHVNEKRVVGFVRPRFLPLP